MTDSPNGLGHARGHRLFPVPGQCPVCGEELHVTRLGCGTCATGIDGHFALDRFSRLSAEHLGFLEVFIKNRGVIKDVEAELGISYPTVRARLDEAIRGLGFPAAPDDALRPSQVREERRQILEALRGKTISADEAASRLTALTARK